MQRTDLLRLTAARGSCLRARAVAQQITIAIATGGTGGVYYPLGGGMANVLSKYVPGCTPRPRASPAARSTISS